MSDEQPPTGNGKGDIVALPRAPLARPDTLLEELSVVRMEGRYFCFDKHEAKRRNGVLEYRDGLRGLLIEVSSRYGHPSILAYKVLQAIFRKVTLEGKPYPATVSFTYRELARLVGRDIFGGRDGKQLYEAIRQLEDTKVEAFLYDKDEKKNYKSYRFSLIIASGFMASGDVTTPDRMKAASLTLHPVIVDKIRQGHFTIFNWDRLSQLEPLAAALYKRLYLHFSNLYENQYDRRSLKFEKNYVDICGGWLGGLTPERYKSRITKQLGAVFADLHNAGIVRSIVIEPMADGAGFKLVFRPGSGFFDDYQSFYHAEGRVLQFQQAADQFHIQAPLALLAHFYTKLHNDTPQPEGAIYAERDVEFVKRLIAQFDEEQVRDLIDFALEEAPKTKFAMATIRAIEGYLPKWQGAQAERERRLAVKREESVRRAKEQLHREYDEFCRASFLDFLSQCAPEERGRIEALARERAASNHPQYLPSSPAFSAAIRSEERGLVREMNPLPSFEEWHANRK